jgi:hypothetical protein
MAAGKSGYIAYLGAGSILAYLALIIYRRWFSSLSKIPGPFLGSFGVWWQVWHSIKGHTEEETIALHRKHGKNVSQIPSKLVC